MGVLRAAAMLDGPGVRLHALLASPLPPSVPAHIRVAALELRSPGARCLHANLVRLSHGPGRTYLLKPLLHFVLPPSVRRVLVLDTDVVMIRPLAELWGQFARFGPEAVLGLVAEQSSLYPGNAIGKNGGVQLLHLERMRRSPAYAAALDHYATGRGGAWATSATRRSTPAWRTRTGRSSTALVASGTVSSQCISGSRRSGSMRVPPRAGFCTQTRRT